MTSILNLDFKYLTVLICSSSWTLEETSSIISIITPCILLLWFYYSQKQSLSKTYFDQIDGIYAGFTDPISKIKDKSELSAGIIMNIKDTDDKGYFKGEFDFGETQESVKNGEIIFRPVRAGIHFFLGKMDFEIYKNKTRHPFRPKENRKYKGILYIVDRLDFSFEDYRIETYLRAEYDIVHYREMQTLKFTLKTKHKTEQPDLPATFTLYKKMGASFEPYKNVKESVFINGTLSDRE